MSNRSAETILREMSKQFPDAPAWTKYLEGVFQAAVENALLVERTSREPLHVEGHGQAITWAQKFLWLVQHPVKDEADPQTSSESAKKPGKKLDARPGT